MSIMPTSGLSKKTRLKNNGSPEKKSKEILGQKKEISLPVTELNAKQKPKT